MKSFEQFLSGQGAEIAIGDFAINLVLAALLAFLLARVYVRFGSSLSNRQLFGRNFVQLTMTTMLIITVVKSSLALSLGLVGALSIVRFRAAIKEPEELSYLFLAIAVGLGLGADQRLVTLVGFVLITGTIALKGRVSASAAQENLHLTIASQGPDKVELERLVDVLTPHCNAIKLKRLDDTAEVLEASFLVEYEDLDQFQASKKALQELGSSVRITFLDSSGLY